MTLRGRVVIVTGAAQGIGRYLARGFASEGAKLVLADISSMETVSEELSNKDADFIAVKTDVCDEKQVASMVRQAYERYGRIDVLVNNAGIVPHFSTGAPRWPKVRDMPREQFQRVIDTNLIGMFLCSKHVIPYMESLRDGHIINFGQGNLRKGSRPSDAGTCAYSTSKISIRAFTRLLADEERDFNICVVSVGPTLNGPRREPGRGIAGNGGGVVHDDSPEWARRQDRPTVEALGNRYLLAAEAPIELSGEQLTDKDGQLVIVPD